MPGNQVVVTDGQGQAAKQSADVDDLLARGVKVLLLTPLTAEALTPVAKRAMDAGIPVVTLDRAVDTDVTQHIGADNKLIGQKAAEYVAKTVLGGKGGRVIEIQGVLGASATTDRNKEFVSWLGKNAPDVKIVASQTGEYRREPALKYMEDMLQRVGPGEFDVVYAHNDEMALGAIQALKAANRLDEVKVSGSTGRTRPSRRSPTATWPPPSPTTTSANRPASRPRCCWTGTRTSPGSGSCRRPRSTPQRRPVGRQGLLTQPAAWSTPREART
jgi:ribose transport system substrate-binding protein